MSAPKPDCYDYIRGYYSVPAYVGVRVKLRNGREGVIVPAKHSLHYVHIQLDGDRRSDVYHPTDGVQYVLTRQAAPETTNAAPVTACVFGVFCRRHGFIHGAEAEELRSRVEKILDSIDHEGDDAADELDRQLRMMLDEVDARDSLAWIETKAS